MVHIFGVFSSHSHLNGKIMLALLKPRFLATIRYILRLCGVGDENDEGKEFKFKSDSSEITVEWKFNFYATNLIFVR